MAGNARALGGGCPRGFVSGTFAGVMICLRLNGLTKIAVVLVAAACIGCGVESSNNGDGGTAGSGGAPGSSVQGYANLCTRICESAGRCVVEPSGSGRAAIQRCRLSCTENVQELDPNQITQACLDASSDSVFCYENVSCESVDDGSACQEEDDRALAACPTLGAGACDFDCSGCASNVIRDVCQASVITCETTTCCAGLYSLYAECSEAGGECNFDCSLCAGETRSMCESFQGVCDTLAGAERTTCCNDVTAIYSIMCRS